MAEMASRHYVRVSLTVSTRLLNEVGTRAAGSWYLERPPILID